MELASVLTFSLFISCWLIFDVIVFAMLVVNIIDTNDFINETFKFIYFIEQLKALYEDGNLYCPFTPSKRNRYTLFGLILLSILWVITFGIVLIPAVIIGYLIWAGHWIFIKLCIKNVDD